jgi:hypothetical protein
MCGNLPTLQRYYQRVEEDLDFLADEMKNRFVAGAMRQSVFSGTNLFLANSLRAKNSRFLLPQPRHASHLMNNRVSSMIQCICTYLKKIRKDDTNKTLFPTQSVYKTNQPNLAVEYRLSSQIMSANHYISTGSICCSTRHPRFQADGNFKEEVIW